MTEPRTERTTESSASTVNGSEKPDLVTKLVSARPIRSNSATERLAATLEKLGADPAVVAAAKKG